MKSKSAQVACQEDVYGNRGKAPHILKLFEWWA